MRTRWLSGWRGGAVWCAGVAVACTGVGLLLPRWASYHRAPDPSGGPPNRAWRGTVIDRVDSPREVTLPSVALRTRIAAGPHSGAEFSDTVVTAMQGRAEQLPRVGDTVLCHLGDDESPRGQVSSRVREGPLLVLTGVFLALLGLVGGAKGVRTAASLVIAVWMVVGVLLPLSRAGHDPLLVAIPAAAVVAAAGILLIAGPNRKALSAVVGTAAGAALAGVLAVLACRHLAYTGLAIDFGPQMNLDVAYWYSRRLARVDFAGLLAAGMVISALGATMDVAVGVASAAAEVRARAPQATRRRVGLAGLHVGQHMLGTMAVTLFFIYVGGGLLLFVALRSVPSVQGWLELMNYEAVGAAVVRLLAVAIGLAAAIPVTALAAALLLRRDTDARP